MKYEKPEVVGMGSAIQAIQTHNPKGNGNPDNQKAQTPGTAYEADE